MEDISCLDGVAQLSPKGGRIVAPYDEWWKLRERYRSEKYGPARKFLRQHKYGFAQGTAFSRLAYLCTRAQRGLISYFDRPIAELRQFCAQRSLPGVHGLKKVELVKLLEAEDEEASFPRFLELPAELRVLVYGFSFNVVKGEEVQGFRQSPLGIRLVPPPVTAASKMLRKESLPLYHTTAGLYIRAIYQRSDAVSSHRAVSWPNDYKLDLHRMTTSLFKNVPILALQSIRTIYFRIDVGRNDDFRSEITWEIALPTARTPCGLKNLRRENSNDPLGANELDEIEDGIRKVFNDKLNGRQGERLILRRKDIYDLYKAFPVTRRQ
ncbi:uncharacterized protein RCC_05002 [Ramularia collo-cygni]|uniref:Uncharacterized protein n=1 Tax=Ramularia collo-cygni TaxID=112498 RepID=A0A2D3V6J1_9PEZI|nr:uncharacterized protein RCC_05002 [Ramularia collo-cygni]CZT19156.1 uncharacterized protein RCC_05002 [Ramularia collo-cygni]